ncbi:YqaA family protein [Salinibius halmophilus]|uniref:YqaA family protein n=1 Tax=Salinibius halmophilus TaxID=1853216 RepID=UPI000E65F39E|nr:VTT domain-containing protein [Salinibius halmophilus]
MKKRLADNFVAIVHKPWVFPALFVFSFLESIIVPIPLEFVLVPLMLKSDSKRIWALAATALLGFLAGAGVGYFGAVYLFEQISPWLLQTQQSQEYYQAALGEMQQNGFWYLIAVGATPVPSQIAMLAAGSTGYPLVLFFLAMLTTRSFRYFAMAYVMDRWGKSGYQWLKTHKSRASKIAAVLLVLALIYELFID